MNSGLFSLRALFSLLILFVLACALVHAADEVAFTFQPPDEGITFNQTQVSTETVSMTFDGKSRNTVEINVSKWKTVIEKSATGYNMTLTLTAQSKMVNNEPKDLDPFEKVLLNESIILELDPNGQVLEIKGVKEMIAKAREKMKPEFLAVFDRLVTAEKIERQGRQEWQDTVKAFSGKNKQLGETWDIEQHQSLFSTDPTPVTARVTLQNRVTTADRPCVVTKIAWSLDPETAAECLRTTAGIIGFAPSEKANPTYTVFNYSSLTYLHLDTMLLTPMKANETLSYKFKIAAQGKSLVVVSKKETTTTTEIVKK